MEGVWEERGVWVWAGFGGVGSAKGEDEGEDEGENDGENDGLIWSQSEFTLNLWSFPLPHEGSYRIVRQTDSNQLLLKRPEASTA